MFRCTWYYFNKSKSKVKKGGKPYIIIFIVDYFMSQFDYFMSQFDYFMSQFDYFISMILDSCTLLGQTTDERRSTMNLLTKA